MLSAVLGNRITTIVLTVGFSISALVLVSAMSRAHLPGNQQDYEPVQPIQFSHRLHVGELEISCKYCHSEVETSRHAGIPPSSTCMNCHTSIRAARGKIMAEEDLAKEEERDSKPIESEELRKLYDTLALDKDLKPIPGKLPVPVDWIRVHELPDYVYFDHRAHISANVSCKECHGTVKAMERIRQVGDLSMGWCLNCHRRVNKEGVDGLKVHASTDCMTCHH